MSQLGGTSRSQVLPRKIGKCVLNDPVFKFKIYSVEMHAGFEHKYETNGSVASVRFWVRPALKTLTKNFCEYLQVLNFHNCGT